jgi:transposase InsO family protein
MHNSDNLSTHQYYTRSSVRRIENQQINNTIVLSEVQERNNLAPSENQFENSEISSFNSENQQEMAEINAALVEALQGLKPQIGELPSFNGSTLPEYFCNAFQRYALINGWSEEKQMLVVPLQLKQAAELWYEGLSEYDPAKTTWESFKEALINRFHDSNKDMSNIQLFNSRKQRHDESVEKYLEEMKKLVKLVRDKTVLNEKMQVITIINNLQPKIKYAIQCSGMIPDNLNDLESKARIAENALKELNQSYDRQNRNKSVKRFHPQHTESKNYRARESSSVTCYLCNETGHIKPNCPKLQTLNENKTKESTYNNVKCYSCGTRGHVSSSCPNKKTYVVKEEKKNASINVIGTNNTSEDIRLHDVDFIATAHVGDVRVTVGFDTGSSVNCISAQFYKRMDQDTYPLQPSNYQFNAATGGEMKCIGSVSLPVEINVDGTTTKSSIMKFYVIKDLTESVLIGRGQVKKIELEDGTTISRNDNVVRVKQAVTIPPHSIKLIKIVAENNHFNSDDASVMFEPFHRKHGVVARSITRTRSMVTNIVNTNGKPIHISANEIVGVVTPVEVQKETDQNDEADKIASSSSSSNTNKQQVVKTISVDKFQVDVKQQISSKLKESEQKAVLNVLTKYRDVFAENPKAPACTTSVKHVINTGNAAPIKLKPYRTSKVEQEMIEQEVNELLSNNIIRESSSPWSAPVVLVDKADGSKRFCIDYRMINNVTVKDSYPIPVIRDAIDLLHGARYFSTIDFCSGYWQIGVDSDSIPKTAFVTKSGLWEWLRMPFGLCNAPSTFQRCMDVMLTGLNWKCCLVYIDDILVFSNSLEEHIEHLSQIFERLRKHNYSIKLSKCWFGNEETTYLGHLINQHGVQPHPNKVEAIVKFKTPSSLTDVRSFMGLVNYYHRFVNNLGTIAAPLYGLMKKNVTFYWSEACEKAFQQIKSILVTSPILRYPDFTKEFILCCDASDVGVASILSQIDDNNNEYVVAYASRSLSSEEVRYTTTEKECLAVIFGIKQFRTYLYGKHFTVYTDHSSLQWLLKLKDSNARLLRWSLQLQGVNFTIKHRSGNLNGNADALSRAPLAIQVVTTRAKQRQQNRNDDAVVVVNRRRREHNGTQLQQSDTSTSISRSNSNIGGDINEEKQLPTPQQVQEQFQKAQLEDENLRPMIEYLQFNKLPDNSSEASKIKINSSSYILEDGMLKHIWIPTNTNRNTDVRKQIVVPNILRQQIMSEYHDSYSGGHFSTNKTFDKIRDRYWWLTLYKDVDQYTKSCEVCQRRNVPRREQQTALMTTPISDGPFSRWGVDVVGPLPETKNGNKYLVVFTDSFTRWVEVFYTSEVKEEFIAEFLVCEIVCRYGAPKYLVSDRGANFLSALSMKIYELLKINKVNTTSYHPQSNGIVERFNATLINMLAKFSNEDDWDSYVPYILSAYRSSYNSTIEETPYYMTFGKQMVLPYDAMLNAGEAYYGSRSDYCDEIAYRITESNKRVKSLLNQIAEKREEKNVNLLNPKEFKTGDLVLLRSEVKPGTNRKLNKQNYIGPYKIIDRISLVNYKIDIPGPGPKPHNIVHVDRLKRYRNPNTTAAYLASKSVNSVNSTQ